MKHANIAALCAVALPAILASAAASDAPFPFREPNYDEEKVAPYTLEDPLSFAYGRRVEEPADWPERRREILGVFARASQGRLSRPPRHLAHWAAPRLRPAQRGARAFRP